MMMVINTVQSIYAQCVAVVLVISRAGIILGLHLRN